MDRFLTRQQSTRSAGALTKASNGSAAEPRACPSGKEILSVDDQGEFAQPPGAEVVRTAFTGSEGTADIHTVHGIPGGRLREVGLCPIDRAIGYVDLAARRIPAGHAQCETDPGGTDLVTDLGTSGIGESHTVWQPGLQTCERGYGPGWGRPGRNRQPGSGGVAAGFTDESDAVSGWRHPAVVRLPRRRFVAQQDERAPRDLAGQQRPVDRAGQFLRGNGRARSLENADLGGESEHVAHGVVNDGLVD